MPGRKERHSGLVGGSGKDRIAQNQNIVSALLQRRADSEKRMRVAGAAHRLNHNLHHREPYARAIIGIAPQRPSDASSSGRRSYG